MPEPTPPVQRSALPAFAIGLTVVSLSMALAVWLAGADRTPASSAIALTRPAAVAQGINEIGWRVPDFTLNTLAGDAVSLSDYRGKVVFINFWATWCVPCQREMPAFDAFMAQDPQNAVILAINNGEATNLIQDYVRLFRLEHVPILLDTDFTVSDGFGVLQLPITYVLDGEGVVRAFKLGEISAQEIQSYVDEYST
ncbi:MAG: TlpA family protein disulfide reductase [Phototrophicaceae bacterium]